MADKTNNWWFFWTTVAVGGKIGIVISCLASYFIIQVGPSIEDAITAIFIGTILVGSVVGSLIFGGILGGWRVRRVIAYVLVGIAIAALSAACLFPFFYKADFFL